MDATDSAIEFDKQGICNHCRIYEARMKKDLHYDHTGQQKLQRMVAVIKQKGKDKDYDCIIGVSGGVDSTYAAYQAKKLGLRPLAVHLDNGWDSELAVSNIEKMLKKLGIDLLSYVINWEEFRDLHLAFLRSSVANSEIPTDHAITAILYRVADEKGVQYILSGGNLVTEATMPGSWMYDARDLRHLKAIHKKFGKVSLRTFPTLGLFRAAYYIFIKGIKWIPVLNYIPYNKEEAKKILEQELGWRSYGGKHYESIYTRFFQGYILPQKFGIDKRKAHLSTLICSGQITREQALEALKEDIYPLEQMQEDKEYVIKKLGLTEHEFEEIMRQSVKSSLEYPNNAFIFQKFSFILKFVKKVTTWS